MLNLDGITKRYKNDTVLKNIDLEIKQRKGIVSLIGPNGAGKSTMLRLMSGILLPSSGNIAIFNGEAYVTKNDYDLRKEVAFIPASERMLYFKLSVKDNIILYNVLRGMSKKDIIEQYEKIIQCINLKGLEDRLVETLSTGEKKKALLACALCSNCKIIILDEPTIGLDYDAKIDLKNLLLDKDINKDKLFIVSSHDFDLLSNLSEENIFIFDGEITKIVYGKISNGKLTEIYSDRGRVQ